MRRRTRANPPPASRVRLEISLSALRDNFRRIAARVRPCRVMAVLKANAYGLGSLEVAGALRDLGVDRFGVAEIKEALPLVRRFGLPVQILSGLLASEVAPAVAAGVVCPVTDLALARALSREARARGKRVKVHIKLDTGMGRMGIPAAEAPAVIRRIRSLPNLEFEGIFSHFANADNPRSGKTREQLARFQAVVAELEAEGMGFPLVHMANSDAINNYPEAYGSGRFDLVRTGINLYGVFDLSSYGHRALPLRPTLSLKTTLLAVRHLPAGHAIGYGGTHVLFRDTRVGTIPAGYADGIPLAASNSGLVLIRGRACRIIGRVSMDYITVDLADCPAAKVGDPVILVGRSGRESITIEDWARVKQTHPYDIICALGPRVERVYLGGDRARGP